MRQKRASARHPRQLMWFLSAASCSVPAGGVGVITQRWSRLYTAHSAQLTSKAKAADGKAY